MNKPSGLFIHRSKEDWQTRENLLAITRDYLGKFVYPINRIDRPVSGIVAFGKSSDSANALKEKWHDESTKKYYLALVKGSLLEPGEFAFDLSDENKLKKTAITKYWPLFCPTHSPLTTLCKIQILTGRRHQIRRHFSRRMHQIIGDTTHGKGRINHHFRDEYNLNRIFLHAYKFEFIHPYQNRPQEIICELPDDLNFALSEMANQSVCLKD